MTKLIMMTFFDLQKGIQPNNTEGTVNIGVKQQVATSVMWRPDGSY